MGNQVQCELDLMVGDVGSNCVSGKDYIAKHRGPTAS
jgi:hypothetical protein